MTTATNPVERVRLRVGDALFLKVAGPDGYAHRDRIHLTPGPRWFAPDSPIGRVHGDASMFVGGLRALLLQSLHPLAMAAVDDFSDVRHDVWGRLARTSTFLAETTPDQPFHTVLADPPYGLEEAGAVLALLGGWLSPEAVIMWEQSTRAAPVIWPAPFVDLGTRTYGQTRVSFAELPS